MLRVGLTGGLGSGKSAVAVLWADAGVPVLQADALGRSLMEPGEPVYRQIVEAFGPRVLTADGALDRAVLARTAFTAGGLHRLNALVHPAVVAEQARLLDALEAGGEHPLAVVESALIFEASGDGSAAATVPGWRERFHRIVLVTAPEQERIARYVRRVGGPDAGAEEQARLADDARRRIAAQLPDNRKRVHADYILKNNRSLVLLRREALALLETLRKEAAAVSRRRLTS